MSEHNCRIGRVFSKISGHLIPEHRASNVAALNIVTKISHDPSRILANALASGMTEVVVVGFTASGDDYFASSVSDTGAAMWHLQRGIHELNRIIDRMTEGRDAPRRA